MAVLAAAALWCVLLLGAQVLRARSYGRKPLYAPASGDPRAGARYAFTGAMLPWAKESVREHPASYLAGLLYHAGIFSGAALLFLRFRPLAAPALAGALAGLGLLAKRALDPHLRGLSNADDYISNLLATGFALLAGLGAFLPAAAAALPWWGAALLAWIPLGKIRHCVFFFLSRYHLGVFFGRRGTFPMPQEPR